MTRLDAEQEAAIKKIEARKKAFDKGKARLEIEFKLGLDELKDPIREAVQEAADLGVPVRQIHMRGLGFKQVNSMVTFLDHKTETLGEKTSRILGTQKATIEEEPDGSVSVRYEAPAKAGLKVRETENENEWWIMDEDGDDWMIHVIPTGGTWFVINVNDLANAANPDAIKEAIVNHKPGRVHWGTDDLD